MSETTLRLKSIADVAALNEWTRSLTAAREALVRFNEATRSGGGAVGAGGPAGPSERGTSAGGTPAPAGAPTGAPGLTAAPAVAPQAPTCPPPPAPYQPAPAAQPAAPGESYAPTTSPALIDPSRPTINLPPPPGREAQQGASRGDNAGGYITGMAQTAMAIGLGAGIAGFLLNAGQTFMQLDRVVGTLSHRFREAGENVSGLGAKMGFTIAQNAGMVESYGGKVNTVQRETFQRDVGFARTYGMDPTSTLGSLGTIENMRGRGMSDRDLAKIAGHAEHNNMGRGRSSEYLGRVSNIMESQFEATGATNLNAALAIKDLPGMIFGRGSYAAEGQMGQQFMGGLNQALTGSEAGKMQLMRAIGFGSKGSKMSYVDMRKRTEAGATDPENIKALFASWKTRGLDEQHQIRAFEGLGSGLKMWQIEKLVQGMNGGAGNTLADTTDGAYDDKFVGRAMAGAGMAAADYTEFGENHTKRIGETHEVKMEGVKMEAGKYVAQGIVDASDTVINLAKSIDNFLGLDIGRAFTDFTGAMKHLSETIEHASEAGSGFRTATDFTPNSQGAIDAVAGYNKMLDQGYAQMPMGNYIALLNLYQDMRKLYDMYGSDGGAQ